jgi:hypothetical protein
MPHAVKCRGRSGVCEVEVTVLDHQKPCGFQTLRKLGDGSLKGLEANQVSAGSPCPPSKAAVAEHRHAKDGVVVRRWLTFDRTCLNEVDVRVIG